jgi:hypothetical protein
MKLWATLATAGILASGVFANSTSKTTQDEPNKWNIHVGFAIPDGDHKDLGVDNMFSIGADWMLSNNNGMSGSSDSFIGVLAMFGSGDGSLDSMTYGIHYGLMFGLGGQGGGMNNFSLKVQGGFYNTKLDDDFAEADEWGFGGSINLVYVPTGGGFQFGAGYYFMPEVEGVDNRGFTIFVSIPVK